MTSPRWRVAMYERGCTHCGKRTVWCVRGLGPISGKPMTHSPLFGNRREAREYAAHLNALEESWK